MMMKNKIRITNLIKKEENPIARNYLELLKKVDPKNDLKTYNNIYAKYYRLKNVEKHRKYLRKYYSVNKKNILINQKKYRGDQEVIKRRKQMMRRKLQTYQLEIFDYIGKRKCHYCGIKDPDVLELEHIGRKDSRFFTIFTLYHYVKNKNKDIKKNFRVTCANCLMKKRRTAIID